jgi:hypothetical protein
MSRQRERPRGGGEDEASALRRVDEELEDPPLCDAPKEAGGGGKSLNMSATAGMSGAPPLFSQTWGSGGDLGNTNVSRGTKACAVGVHHDFLLLLVLLMALQLGLWWRCRNVGHNRRLDEEDKPKNEHNDPRAIGPQGEVADDERDRHKGGGGQGDDDDGDGGVQRGDCWDFKGKFYAKPGGQR